TLNSENPSHTITRFLPSSLTEVWSMVSTDGSTCPSTWPCADVTPASTGATLADGNTTCAGASRIDAVSSLRGFVVPARCLIAEPREKGRGEHRGAFRSRDGLTEARPSAAREHAVHRSQKIHGRSGKDRVQQGAQLGGPGKHAVGISPAQGVHDLRRRLFDGNRGERQRVADAEPGILRAVTALEQGVARAPRAHEPRTDGAHLYALAGEFGTEALREADQGELARAVRQEVRHADLAADGGHVHDATGPPASHWGQHGHDGVERSPEIGLHGQAEVLDAHGVNGTYRDDAGIVDERVDRTQLTGRARDEAFDLVLTGHVTNHREHVPVGSGQLRTRPLEGRLVPSTDGDPRSLAQ